MNFHSHLKDMQMENVNLFGRRLMRTVVKFCTILCQEMLVQVSTFKYMKVVKLLTLIQALKLVTATIIKLKHITPLALIRSLKC